MSLSKKFLEDLCKILGHDIEAAQVDSAGRIHLPTFDISATCTRCGKNSAAVKVKYSDLMSSKYNVLDRAKQKIIRAFNEEAS